MRHASILSFAVALLCAAVASADSIGPTGCTNGTCQGGIYTLTYSGSPIATGVGTETFRITLSIDTTGLSTSPNPAVQISDVSVKVGPSILDGSLFSAPGGTGNWTEALGGINAAGCDGNTSNGFDCATANTTTVATLPFAGTYKWVFDIQVATGTLLTGTDAASIKARFLDASGAKTGDLVSEPITLQVPEPGSLALLATGLLGLVVMGRRRSL